ncbi:MAG: EVE domain-containing protein [Chloroflexota bacterium]|nr:EVE domain-containing protein [Chloroflexota bacterium]
MNYWMLVSSAENFETSRRRGFDLAGMKSRHGKKAADVRPGDKVIFYLTGAMAFGGTAEVTGEAVYSEEPIWTSKKDGELYPHRFPIRLEAATEPGEYVPAARLVEAMQYTKKWPAEHWRLAFQGNVHRLPREDYEFIRDAVAERSTAHAS